MKERVLMTQGSRWYWLLLLSGCLLSACAWPSRLAAETPLCTWGGYSALHEAVAVFDYPPKALGGAGQKTVVVRHATLRALLAVERCPQTAEQAFSENPKSTEQWIAAILQILEPYFPKELTRVNVGELAQGIACSANTPSVCEIRRQLLGLSRGASHTKTPSDTCIALGPTLMREAVADLKDSGGDFVAATSDLAFLLSFCPDSFFAYMHDHRGELEPWLIGLQNDLFWGDPKDESLLKAYRAALIDFVEHRSTGYAAEKNQVLQRLQAAHVRVTQ